MHRRLAALTSTLLCVVMASIAIAADKPGTIKLCHENEDSYPWLFKDRPGLNIIMMHAVEKQLGLHLDIQALPWKRCLEDLRQGLVDGVFKISFKADRMEMGQYPMLGDKPDASKRMLTDSYSLYRIKGSKVEWDGKTLKGVDIPVGAQSGFSVVDQLKGLGAKVDDGTRTADDNLKKLLVNRVSAVALQTEEGDNSVASNPEFKARIEKVEPALVEKPYFLLFSKTFYAQHGDMAKQMWDAIASVRESADYKKQVQQFK